jgi:hypothetical protein
MEGENKTSHVFTSDTSMKYKITKQEVLRALNNVTKFLKKPEVKAILQKILQLLIQHYFE